MSNEELQKEAKESFEKRGFLAIDFEPYEVGYLAGRQRSAEEFSKLREENQWVSVGEGGGYPPARTNVWCLNADGHQFEGRICYGMHEPFFTYPRGDGSPSNTAPNWINVTHWRPLPGGPIKR